MNSISRRLLTPDLLLIVMATLLSACSAAIAPVTTTSGPTAQPSPSLIVSASLPVDAAITGVSLSKPTADSAAVFAACHLGDLDLVPIADVTGVGVIPSAKDISHYVGLTGREPQFASPGPVWIVTVHYELRQPVGKEIWVDPTCVVTGQESGWYATGPVKNTATGKVTLPQFGPSTPPDRTVPPLAP